MLIDSHCHLDAGEFDADRASVHARARAAGVMIQVLPAISLANCATVAATCARYPGCMPAWGMHPMYIATHRPQHLAGLREWIERQRPVALGEIGLDLFVPGLDPQQQTFYFVEQLKLACEFDLPVLLHCRRANDPVLKELRRLGVKRGIAHAFSGSRQQADAFIRQGFMLGFGGAFTWSRASRLRLLAQELPLECMVLETDSPDIPPAWLGRDRNEPAELAGICARLAELRGISPAEVAARTTANARALFGLTDDSSGTLPPPDDRWQGG